MPQLQQDHILSTGMSTVSDLRDILRAISRLAELSGDSVISKLAEIGIRSATDAHNTLESAAESDK
ncbi:hypothetical protein I5R65_07590 [Herbaspirillum sp. AP02]|uniref:hypothetical protein n=1 Tax=unclassified Herbaspirillum TaxID=2624150 RepID=UPI0015DAB9E2|nr:MULTISPECIES: hypothetical protein [unclassified Herbaspirillum]MBG7619322.1 hypothetical protein [Herbaspirillum sp. AP02]NZD66606.1 hypothetical protein [Herbaspirillum sp. AP21]